MPRSAELSPNTFVASASDCSAYVSGCTPQGEWFAFFAFFFEGGGAAVFEVSILPAHSYEWDAGGRAFPCASSAVARQRLLTLASAPAAQVRVHLTKGVQRILRRGPSLRVRCDFCRPSMPAHRCALRAFASDSARTVTSSRTICTSSARKGSRRSGAPSRRSRPPRPRRASTPPWRPPGRRCSTARRGARRGSRSARPCSRSAAAAPRASTACPSSPLPPPPSRARPRPGSCPRPRPRRLSAARARPGAHASEAARCTAPRTSCATRSRRRPAARASRARLPLPQSRSRPRPVVNFLT